MAIPTIESVSPAVGHTGGRALIEIVGTGFRLPVPPAPVNGITPEAPPSVRVLFGSTPALEVAVLSASRLYVTTPIHDPTDEPISITVQNVDDAGDVIDDESVVLEAAFRFVRPNVTDGRSDLVRVIDALVAELRRQITPNVSWPEHTDFDEATGDTLSMTEVPDLPGLVVAAVELVDNDFYAERSRVEVEDPDDPTTFVELAPPTTVDIVCTIVGVSDSSKELLNLTATAKRFFRKNPYLRMARDPDDASKGEVAYELEAQDSPGVKLSVEGNASNLRTFALVARIVGFDIEAMHEIRDEDGEVVRGPHGAGEATTQIGRTLEDGVVLSIES